MELGRCRGGGYVLKGDWQRGGLEDTVYEGGKRVTLVNCQLSTSNTPQTLPGDVPWKSTFCLPSQYLRKYYFQAIF